MFWFMKKHTNAQKSEQWAKVRKGMGIFFLFWGFLFQFSPLIIDDPIYDPEVLPFVVMGVLFLLAGAYLFYNGRNLARLSMDFRKYTAILANDPVKTIYRIAEITGETAEAVRAKVNRMIEKGFFVNAYIDQSGKIVLADRSKMDDVVGNNDDRMDFVTVTCPACGGVNRLAKGKVGKCEFCGAYISDKA